MPESHDGCLSAGGSEEYEGRYRTLLAAIKDGFSLNEVICDPPGRPYDFRILDVNPAFERLMGFKKEHLVGRTYRQLAGAVDPILIERCGRVALSGDQDAFEIYSHKIERHFELNVYRPAPLQFAALIRESREEMRMVDNLRICEAKSRALLDSIPDLIFHITEDGAILDCRTQASDGLLNPQSFIGGRLDELLPPDLAQKVFARMVVAHKSSSVTSFECRASLGGVERDYEARMVYGKEGSFVLLLRDISEEKRIQEALIESERRFRAAVENIPNFFVIYDEKLRFIYANRVAAEIMGLSGDEIYGHSNEELFSAQAIKPYIDHLRRAWETKSLQKVEHCHILSSGKITFFTIYVPIIDDKGNLAQVLGISHDITAIRNTESRLRLALEENRKQNRVLNSVVEEMKSNYDEIEQLLYMISHDLMTPLITISGFLELLRKDVEKCNRIRVEIDLGLIGDAVSRMHALLAKSLEISSLGMLSSPRDRIPFEGILDEAKEHFKNICDPESNDLLITSDEGFPPVYAHKRRMVDILISMIDSCISYSGRHSELASAEPSEGLSCPQVHVGWRKGDDGPVFFARCKGSAKQEDLEEAFRHCCDEGGEESSTTIGLAVSKKIIELQGGRMWMECDPKSGCTILFLLPEAIKGQ